MRTSRCAVTFLATSALAVTLAGCAINQAQEVDMGKNYSTQIAKQLRLVQDPDITAYINFLGDSLARLTERRDLEWHFEVVDDVDVNAFAVPGGYIYVNRGLIERSKTMAQVAGVIGHEIGHVVRRHSVKQMQKAQGANLVVTAGCLLSRVCDGSVGQTAIQLGGGLVFSKFSRDDEAEADAEGVRLMVRARIDPHGIPEMFRILLDERKQTPGVTESFFASHPLEENRIAASSALIATYPAGDLKGLASDSPFFQAFKKKLAALPPPPKKKS